jgi:hypothetical protein
MEPVTNLEGFLWGWVGGFAFTLGECLLFRRAMPDFMRRSFYWVVGIVVGGAGGLLVLMHLWSEPVKFSPLVAFHMGTWAPLFLSVIGKHAPLMKPGEVD